MGTMVASRLGGDSHVAIGIVVTEMGLEGGKGLGARVKAPAVPVTARVVEEAGGVNDFVPNADDSMAVGRAGGARLHSCGCSWHQGHRR